MRKYYVTHYKDYPVFRPEEGGYYVSGTEMIDSEKFSTLKEARKFLNEVEKNDDMKKIGLNCYAIHSKYIGDDEYIKIEKKQGHDIRGIQPYE